ncbi:hypothetical protein MSAS_51480 [Mycobacterium saskatchewanense]|uniref:LLM class F420-dependent oxidoreductase n=1 Tax=Mycobacterium saskatchewanense TaxID=220927 RepID=A0AAJ3NRK8_9MYCO|nr:LLM class F420-dependent oxidoreductase [Mycobacterium saskatchewanense]ORW72763.1 LLM class F420-dependent oxidoreductase [Mycobacterium saskatchewanense]BBX65974.1 hypothetical protein MSAS_51480 [Mycobacterium saskatchewanense]
MRVGVIFPQTEIAVDPLSVRTYCEQVEALGFDHMLAYEHVLGADPAVHFGWDGVYDVDSTFHEPFVLFGYIAALTTQLQLVTGVLILPQRQTALVAKQAAEVDVLSGGRLRLGVGLGWNAVEYEALGADFTNRGRRIEEQIGLLRALWTQPSVTFHEEYHRVTGAGLAPQPTQRPIPVWLGATSPRAYRRVGRCADGWFPLVQPGQELNSARDVIQHSAIEAGRDPTTIRMEGRVQWNGDPHDVDRQLEAWRAAGASHVTINTMNAGLRSTDEHLDALASITRLLDLHHSSE